MFQLISFMCFDTKQKPLKPPEPPFNQPSNAANLVPIERNKRSGARWVKSMDHLEKSQRIQLRRVKFSLAITGCKVVNEILSSSNFLGGELGVTRKNTGTSHPVPPFEFLTIFKPRYPKDLYDHKSLNARWMLWALQTITATALCSYTPCRFHPRVSAGPSCDK